MPMIVERSSLLHKDPLYNHVTKGTCPDYPTDPTQNPL